jgi:hypothetical protein
MIIITIKNHTSDQLLEIFIQKGGKINKHYLHAWNRNKPALVYLNGWFRGKNIRDAVIRALA